MIIYSAFTHWKCWFSIFMLVYRRVLGGSDGACWSFQVLHGSQLLGETERETSRWIFGRSQETWPQVGGLEHGNNNGDLWWFLTVFFPKLFGIPTEFCEFPFSWEFHNGNSWWFIGNSPTKMVVVLIGNSIYWEFYHPNWRTHIFQRGRLNHQPHGDFMCFFNGKTGDLYTEIFHGDVGWDGCDHRLWCSWLVARVSQSFIQV